MALPSPSLSLDEFLELPDTKPALEYAHGVVTQKVSPKAKHSKLQTVLARDLDEAGEGDRVAQTFTELRTTYAGASFVPDISVYRSERVPFDADGELVDDLTELPLDRQDESVVAFATKALTRL